MKTRDHIRVLQAEIERLQLRIAELEKSQPLIAHPPLPSPPPPLSPNPPWWPQVWYVSM